MAGYLDQYGEGDERRSRIIKTTITAALAVLILGGGLYWYFQDYSQEREVKQFFSLLAKRNYPGAYQLWGCSDARPCRDYPEQAFMGDWGPQAIRNPEAAHITSVESCGSGVIIKAEVGGELRTLWVERDTATLGFSPMDICPGRGPLKIMFTRLRNRLR